MYTKEQVQKAESQLRAYIHRNRTAAAQYNSFLSDYHELDKVLANMPNKIRHSIMVPISTVAFMEGYIEQTNEVTVLIGDNYFVKCSVSHARSILKRRIDFTQDKLDALEEEYKLVRSRVGLASEWLEIDDESMIEEVSDEISELKLPYSSNTTNAKPPKIQIISSTENESQMDENIDKSDIDTPDDLMKKRIARIRELEASGVEMSDEELANILGVSLTEYDSYSNANPAESSLSNQESGIIEITEHHKPDGTVEAFLTPKGNPSIQPSSSKSSKSILPEVKSKSKMVLKPVREIVENETDVVNVSLAPSRDNKEAAAVPEATAPKKTSLFKKMRDQSN